MPGDTTTDRVNELYYGQIFDVALQKACQDRIHWICSQVVGNDVLDIGCSQGITCLLLGREGHQVVGVDINPSAIEHAKRELEEESECVKRNVKFSLAGGDALPFSDESFDTVILGELVEHLTRPERVLREAHRLLRSQGRVLITTPFGIHPHPSHVRTFYLGNFVEMIRESFSLHTLRVVNGYIYCVAVKDPSPDKVRSDWSPEKLLELSEAAFHRKEERHWEQRDRLAEQAKSLREEVARHKAAAVESKKAQKQAEDTVNRWRKALTTTLDHLRISVHKFNGTQAPVAPAGRGEDELPEERLKTLEELVRQSLLACQAQLKHLEEQSAQRLQSLRQTHANELERLTTQHEQQLQELRQKLAQLQAEQQKLEEQSRRLQADLQKTQDARAKAERLNEQLRSRINSLAEDLRQSEQLHLEQVRYRLGDALIQALDNPKDLVLLPGRLVKLFSDGRRRRRERAELEAAQASVQATSPTPSSSAAVSPPTPSAANPAPASAPSPATQNASNASAPAPKPAATASPASAAAAEVFQRVPSAPHLGTGLDPKETVFAKPPGGTRRRVAIILDEFSRDCFAPEFEPITFRPDNWANVLKTSGADLLLVESAWQGNDGSWQYRIASYNKNMGDELVDLVECCRRNGVPTVFWNKEDPAHFDRFIGKAALFDIVLTTDEDCIPEYRQRLGHDRVYALPFAAQPTIHNPIQTEPRLPKPCFAGTYYRNRHQQRQEDMNLLLRPALAFGLDIYDRMYGAPEKERQNYLFPEEFQPAIRGRLGYSEMVDAYRRYRVFLNVNSVTQSPTMFSRRVFELLACGTPVISTVSRGIEQLLGNNGVFITTSEEQTRQYLEMLLRDDEQWARASALGIRKVLSEHTYAKRFATICRLAGVTGPADEEPFVSVLIAAEPGAGLDRLMEHLAKQRYRRFDVHLFSKKALAATELETLGRKAGGIRVRQYAPANADASLKSFLDQAEGTLVCRLSTGWAYGPEYLADCVRFIQLPNVQILGKACRFQMNGTGEVQVTGAEQENRMVRTAPSATIAIRKAALNQDDLNTLLKDEQFARQDESIFSTFRYDCLVVPATSPIPSRGWMLDAAQ